MTEHDSGSGSPTTQALIDQLESASTLTTFPGYSWLFRAAADALRSLQLAREGMMIHHQQILTEAADRVRAAEAEVARLTQARDTLPTVEQIAQFVEHLRDEYLSTMEPVTKIARLIREQFGAAEGALGPLPPAARRWTEVLCTKCGGNGVVKIPGGISQCPRCDGCCYEPAGPLPPQPLRAQTGPLTPARED